MKEEKAEQIFNIIENLKFQQDFVDGISNVYKTMKEVTIENKRLGVIKIIIRKDDMIEIEISPSGNSRTITINEGADRIYKQINNLVARLISVNKEILDELENELEEL